MLYCEYAIRESRTGRPTEGEASRAKDSRSYETGRRSTTESACTKASAKRDAEPKSGSQYPEGYGTPRR